MDAMTKPLFYVVLGEGENWRIEAEWPDGTIEKVDAFKAHVDAVTWLGTRAEAWLEERQTSGRQVEALGDVVRIPNLQSSTYRRNGARSF
jgi:hypothetical protein